MRGERVERIVQVGETVIEQILSGELDEPLDYDQDHDEWVVVLRGAAELEVNGERLSLETGDWVLLKRRTPHRLVRTTRGTSWLAVHLPGSSSGDSPRLV
jgi:cupin 2 domain-containing protein